MAKAPLVSRTVASLVCLASLVPLASTASSATGCTSTSASFATGCTSFTPDAGTADEACAIGWSCSSNGAVYQLTCTMTSTGDYACACSDGTTTRSLVVNPFVCTSQGALGTADMGCGFDLQE